MWLYRDEARIPEATQIPGRTLAEACPGIDDLIDLAFRQHGAIGLANGDVHQFLRIGGAGPDRDPMIEARDGQLDDCTVLARARRSQGLYPARPSPAQLRN